jgi:hypothetical protein
LTANGKLGNLGLLVGAQLQVKIQAKELGREVAPTRDKEATIVLEVHLTQTLAVIPHAQVWNINLN